ncbi:ERF family protein [Ensifer sp. 1H6]|nr:ERF family protein [Ensifer sp. 1H6]
MNAVAKHEIAAQDETRLVPANDAPMVAMIERIAMDPTIPIDRLEQMLAMKERMEDRNREMAREDREYEAKTAYFSAMSACQKELPVVTKNKRNSHTNSNYADLAAIEDQAMPIIYAHGFGVSFQPDGYNDLGELLIKWEISHSGGYVRNGVGAIPVDGAGAKGGVNKTGTQAFGSTATYGRRYLLCMLFNISTGDDNDGNRPKGPAGPVSEEQATQLRQKVDDAGADIERFCKRWHIGAIPEMPAAKFDEAMASLDRFAQQKKQRQTEEQNNG